MASLCKVFLLAYLHLAAEAAAVSATEGPDFSAQPEQPDEEALFQKNTQRLHDAARAERREGHCADGAPSDCGRTGFTHADPLPSAGEAVASACQGPAAGAEPRLEDETPLFQINAQPLREAESCQGPEDLAQAEEHDEVPLLQVSEQRGPAAAARDASSTAVALGGGNAGRSWPWKDGAWELCHGSFRWGTARLVDSGHYRLNEDIVFEPTEGYMSHNMIPMDSREYPQRAGYFLGWFAALTVEADNVELDCQGHEIKMSKKFHKFQRFFSLIELCSSPFKHSEGPPQFASNLTTPAKPVCARNVTIKNCRFGRTAHHAIHGNDNEGVRIYDCKAYDFEVAAVALNGASKVTIHGLEAGPSLKHTFKAELSQCLFLDHITNTLMRQDQELSDLMKDTPVKLRGVVYSVAEVFEKLGKDLKKYMATGGGPLSAVLGSGKDTPDGSAIYGLLLHRSGVAINDLGFCPDECKDPHAELVYDVTLKDIHIHDLKVKVEQVVATVFGHGKAAMGPAGDIFQMAKFLTDKKCYSYTGNSFQDAQVAIGQLKKDALHKAKMDEKKIQFYFGGSNMPKKVLRWVAGGKTCHESAKFWTNLMDGSKKRKFTCNGDAMNHINKGAIGMRLGFQARVSATQVLIENLVNEGVADMAEYCSGPQPPYKGEDVHGVSLAHMKDIRWFDVQQKGTFSSTNSSRVFPISGLVQMRADDAPGVEAETSADSS